MEGRDLMSVLTRPLGAVLTTDRAECQEAVQMLKAVWTTWQGASSRPPGSWVSGSTVLERVLAGHGH